MVSRFTTPSLGGKSGLPSLIVALPGELLIGPRQANLCLRAFRHDKF